MHRNLHLKKKVFWMFKKDYRKSKGIKMLCLHKKYDIYKENK